jgi:RNA polymerase sigma factor (sigma-70 family)
VSANLALDRTKRRQRLLPASRPESASELVDERDAVVSALRQLPARQREAVVLRFLVDLSEAEVACAMGCTVGAVKSAASRGLDRLRSQLGQKEEQQS